MTTTTKHRCFIPEIEYYCRNCACVKKLRVGTCHGTSRTFGPGKDRGLSVRPLFYLSGPSDRRHLGKTAAYKIWESVGINDVNYNVDRRKHIYSCFQEDKYMYKRYYSFQGTR